MKPFEILLVEDNPGDIHLTMEAFKEGRVLNHLNVVKDGQEAINYLQRKDEYAQSKRPDIILLDLNLPKKDGREVLEEIKADPQFKRIPVVVLTTSIADQDVEGAYGHFANCYIRKPVDLNNFLEVAKRIEDFWLSTVTLPRSDLAYE